MEFPSTLIRSRLAWCRLQRMQALTNEEADRFLAEEEGLLDAMLGRERTDKYGPDQQSRRESYQIGLHDGQALMGLQRWSDARQSISNSRGGRATFFPENQRMA
jgi:hypothetical protein